MSLVDGKYLEKAHGRHGASYKEVHDEGGRPYMTMKMTFSDVPAVRCSKCGHAPFFRGAGEKCPKCGGRLED